MKYFKYSMVIIIWLLFLHPSRVSAAVYLAPAGISQTRDLVDVISEGDTVSLTIYNTKYTLKKTTLNGIRKARVEDAAAIEKLSQLIVEEETDYTKVYETDIRRMSNTQHANEKKSYIWVYASPGSVVEGYIYASIDRYKNVYIKEIAVSINFHNKGIGTALWATMMSGMEKLSAKKFDIETIDHFATLIALHFGFEERFISKILSVLSVDIYLTGEYYFKSPKFYNVLQKARKIILASRKAFTVPSRSH